MMNLDQKLFDKIAENIPFIIISLLYYEVRFVIFGSASAGLLVIFIIRFYSTAHQTNH